MTLPNVIRGAVAHRRLLMSAISIFRECLWHIATYANDVWHNHEHQQQAYHLQCIWFLWDRNHFI